MNRIGCAIGIAIAIAFTYAIISFLNFNVLDYKGQAALVAVSGFSFMTSGYLLFDMAKFKDDELGELKAQRASLIIGLIFVCVYVPLSIGSSFVEVLKVEKQGQNYQAKSGLNSDASNSIYSSGG